jgi:hypothetical protein
MSTMEMPTLKKHRKRAQMLEFKGNKQANINIVDGKRSSMFLESKATMMDQVIRHKERQRQFWQRHKQHSRG